jgi:cytochrome c oxidase cbb3-type subunit 1
MDTATDRLQLETARFSLCWLFLANCIGLLLATLLLFPSLGDTMMPLTYGRWMPLHTEWQLYGWATLPLCGVLFFAFGFNTQPHTQRVRLFHLIWSLALIAGGMSWLSGHASGKLFLNWTGFSRIFFVTALLFLWSLLTHHFVQKETRIGMSPIERRLKGALLIGLYTIPIALFITTRKAGFPPINPESSGATGHSLLASTLGVVGIFGVIPRLLIGPSHRPKLPRLFWSLFGMLCGIYVWMHHGNTSNHELNQQLGLGSLLVLAPVFILHLRSYDWKPNYRIWLHAFCVFWALLTLNGFTNFIPGILEQIKFTNAMVAHAHLAMAGCITTFNILVLGHLGNNRRVDRALTLKPVAFTWIGGLLLYVLTLYGYGYYEAANLHAFYYSDTLTQTAYGLRLIAGLLMAAASLHWFTALFTSKPIPLK